MSFADLQVATGFSITPASHGNSECARSQPLLCPYKARIHCPHLRNNHRLLANCQGVRVFLVHLLRRPLILPEHPEAAVGPVNRAPSPRRLHGLCNEGEFPRRLAYVCLFVKVEPVATRAGAATEGEGVGSCRACACRRFASA